MENAVLFLRLGLPSTLIRHENSAFLQTRGIWKHRLCVIVRTHCFWKRNYSKTMTYRWNCDFPSLKHKSIMTLGTGNVAFWKTFGVVRKENIWCVFRVKPQFEFHRLRVNEALSTSNVTLAYSPYIRDTSLMVRWPSNISSQRMTST